MSQGTRSKANLSGNISDYLIENISEAAIMPETIEDQAATDFAALVAGVGGDANNLYTLLAKSLTIANESNKQLQERVTQNSSNPPFMKLENCLERENIAH